MMKQVIVFAAAAFALTASAGVEENSAAETARLQALLDKGGDVVFPAGMFTVSRTLVVKSGTHLVCEDGFCARLADGANCAILANRLRGDDMETDISVNSDEGDWRSGDNDIEDILIEDLDGGERGYTAVRLLSRNAWVRNVTIRNIHGKFQNNLVSFTHWAKGKYRPGMGHFDNITIEDVTATSSRKTGGTHGGLIWFQDGVQDVGDVVIRRLSRVEGAEYHNTTSTIEIGADTNIRSLTLEDVKQKIPDAKPLLKIADTARIGRLTR